MIKLYGIPNCNKIRNTQKLLSEKGEKFEFINVRKTPIPESTLKKMTAAVGMEALYNRKGTTYRRLKLDYNSMTDRERLDHLLREQSMIKRPLLEKDGRYHVGFDEKAIMDFVSG